MKVGTVKAEGGCCDGMEEGEEGGWGWNQEVLDRNERTLKHFFDFRRWASKLISSANPLDGIESHVGLTRTSGLYQNSFFLSLL